MGRSIIVRAHRVTTHGAMTRTTYVVVRERSVVESYIDAIIVVKERTNES